MQDPPAWRHGMTEPDLEQLGAALAARLGPGDALLLQGPLGAGKTTLARALIRAAMADPALAVPSPTYTLVQRYDTPRGPLHHFDLWRLAGPDDILELGWEEARDGIVLVEWPERLGGHAPLPAWRLEIRLDGEARAVRLSREPAG